MAESNLSGASTYPFRECECSIFVKRGGKTWMRSKKHNLKTRLWQPIRLIAVPEIPNYFFRQATNRATIDGRIYFCGRLTYSFSFYLDNGEFAPKRSPASLTLKWEDKPERVLIVEGDKQIIKIATQEKWFKKPVESIQQVAVETNAELIAFKGDVKVSKWGMKNQSPHLLKSQPKRGLLLVPGNILYISEKSSAKIRLERGPVRTFLGNTMIEFRRKDVLLGIRKEALVRASAGRPGSLTIDRSSGRHDIPIGQETPLVAGDLIQTGPDISGEILLANGQKLKLHPFSRILIEHPVKWHTLSTLLQDQVTSIYEDTLEPAEEKGTG